jgi:ATP-dependent DNA ligase
VTLQSRQLRRLIQAFPDVAAAAAQLGDVVLDRELVVCRAGRFDCAALQDRLRSGPTRVRDLATATPAAYIVFDLLAHDGVDLRDRPYRQRRRNLEKLLARGQPDGLALTPATTDAAVARTWIFGHTHTGPAGVVAKRLDRPPYRPGKRAWQKLRTRVTAEAIVGGVTGTVAAPQELILGRYDRGRLRIAGRTPRRSPTASAQLRALLHPATAHPWPELLPGHPYGGGRTAYTRLTPEVMVELAVDLAVDGPR